jgi:ankyrin repeat protein
VRALLEANALVSAQDESDRTPLHDAAEIGDGNVVKSLLASGAPINAQSHLGATPLHDAVTYDNCQAIEILLIGGSDPTARDSGGRTPLFYAKTAEVVNVLVKAGAWLPARDKQMQTALHYAVKWGTLATISALIDAGINANVIDAQGRTPLFLAAELGYAEKVEILLLNNANPNLEAVDFNTPLHAAASCGNLSVFAILNRVGANMDRINCNGETAVDAAFKGNNDDKALREVFRLWWRNHFGAAEIVCFKGRTFKFAFANTHSTEELCRIIHTFGNYIIPLA